MATSYNGWTVRDRGQLIWFTAAGGSFAAANRDVAVIGEYLITRFDREVEKVHGPVLDDWSYAVRNVRGSTTSISCHASATAWDLNALRHVRGKRGTFTAKQVRALRRILADITDDRGDRVIRWGGDFSTVVDDMHFEVVAGERSVRQAADKIRRLTQEDDVTPEDRKAIAEQSAKLVLAGIRDMLLTDRMVPNQKVNDDDAPARDMTIVGA
ncbi:M15 family metallopeptidase, partial [Kineosporia succinea]